MYEKTLKIKQSYYQNPKHIKIAVTYQGLGLVAFSEGSYLKAKKLLEQDLAIRQEHCQSVSHVRLASSMYTLGLAEEGLGNCAVALNTIEKASGIQFSYYKERTPELLAKEYSPTIAWPIISSKNQKQAVGYYQKALAITKKLFGADNHFVARYHYLLGQAYALDGKTKKSMHEYEKALIVANTALAKIKRPNVRTLRSKNILKLNPN